MRSKKTSFNLAIIEAMQIAVIVCVMYTAVNMIGAYVESRDNAQQSACAE